MGSSETYEQEQERLKQELEGGSDDLHIKPPVMPEVNPLVYKDVEPMLFRGFLHVPANIGGVPFVFKSLNHHEFELLGLSEPAEGRSGIQRFYNLFLAYGVFMVDGVNVLRDRDRWLPQLSAMFQDLNEQARRKVVWHLSEINRKASKAVVLSEAFSMEPQSRLRWAQMRGADITGTAVTGVQGTDCLGMNWGQMTWRALNYFEDLKEQSERDWENAKFIASSMAGKGMSKVHNQDRQRREKELEERFARKDKILRFAVLGEPLDSDKHGGRQVIAARTVEELTTQLENDLKGEKDWHDMVVEAQENRIRSQVQTRAERVQQLQADHTRQWGDTPVIGQTKLEGLSQEEVRFRLERRRQLAAQRLSSQQTFPEHHDPKMSDFVNKWTNTSIKKSDRDPTSVPPVVVSDRPRAVPFKRGK